MRAEYRAGLAGLFFLILFTGCLGNTTTIEGTTTLAPGEYHVETIEINESGIFGINNQRFSYKIGSFQAKVFDVFVFPDRGRAFENYKKTVESGGSIDLPLDTAQLSDVSVFRQSMLPSVEGQRGVYHIVIDNTDVQAEHGGANATDGPINVTYRITVE